MRSKTFSPSGSFCNFMFSSCFCNLLQMTNKNEPYRKSITQLTFQVRFHCVFVAPRPSTFPVFSLRFAAANLFDSICVSALSAHLRLCCVPPLRKSHPWNCQTCLTGSGCGRSPFGLSFVVVLLVLAILASNSSNNLNIHLRFACTADSPSNSSWAKENASKKRRWYSSCRNWVALKQKSIKKRNKRNSTE